jgi:hypothetical protein
MSEVTYDDFIAWKHDKVTKLIFKDLEAARDTCLTRMTESDSLNDPNGLLYLNRLRGYIDAINEFTNLDLKELLTTEEENNEEVYTSRVSDISEIETY